MFMRTLSRCGIGPDMHYSGFNDTVPATDGFKPLTPKLKPSAQRCLTRFFTGDFAS
jgi:hypothetical protein